MFMLAGALAKTTVAAKAASASSTVLNLGSATQAAKGIQNNPMMMKHAGKVINGGMDSSLFSKDDKQKVDSSTNRYVGGLAKAAESGAFGPKGIVVAKIAKVAGALKDMTSKTVEAKSNLSTSMERGAFNHPIPTKKPLSIDEAAGFGKAR